MKIAQIGGSALQAPIYIAQAQGFFARNGLDVQVVTLAGPAQVTAVAAGDVQFAAAGGLALVNSVLNGSSIVGLAALSNLPASSIYSRKEIQSAAQLVGKEIGIAAPGGASDAASQLYLRHEGLSGKVRLVSVGTDAPALLAALQNGVAASVNITPPSTDLAKQAGYNELANLIKLGVPQLNSGIVVSRSYLSSQRDTVIRFLKAYQEAWTFAGDPKNGAAVVSIVAAQTTVSPDVAKQTYDYMAPIWAGEKVPAISPASIQSILDLSALPNAGKAQPADFIDNTALEAAGR